MTWDLFTKAHRADPDTSFAAAEGAESLVSRHHRIILESLVEHTGEELAGLTSLDRYQIMRRMKELVEKGLAHDTGKRRAGKTGRLQVVWAAGLADKRCE